MASEPTGHPWELGDWALRLVASATLPPVFEELMMRGWVLGVVVQWDHARRAGVDAPFSEALERRSILELRPGEWAPLALLVSSVVFALGHTPERWLAGFGYVPVMA